MTFYIPTNQYEEDEQTQITRNQQEHISQQQNHQSTGNHQVISAYQPTTSPSPPQSSQSQSPSSTTLNGYHHSQQSNIHQYHQEPIELNRSPHHQIPTGLEYIHLHSNNNRQQLKQQQLLQHQFLSAEGVYHQALLKSPHKVLLNQLKVNNNLDITSGSGAVVVNQQQNQFHHQLPHDTHEGHLSFKDNRLTKNKQYYHQHELEKQHPLIIIGNNNPSTSLSSNSGRTSGKITSNKLNSSLFTESNKIPGHFTPIIYTNQLGNNLNTKNKNNNNNNNVHLLNKPQLNEGEILKQYNKLLNDNEAAKHNQLQQFRYLQPNLNYRNQQQHQQHQQQQQQHEEEVEQKQPQNQHIHPNHQFYQYQEVNPNEQNNSEDDTKISSAPQLQQNHVGIAQNIIVSTTQRPHFQIITETPGNYQHYSHHNNVPPEIVKTQKTLHQNYRQQESQNAPAALDELTKIHRYQSSSEINSPEHIHSKLTPQQQYVAYLQQQLKQKYPGKYQEQVQQQDLEKYRQAQEEIFLIKPSPSPIPENHINFQDNQGQPNKSPHLNQPLYIYASATAPASAPDTAEKDLIIIQPQQELLRPHLTPQQQNIKIQPTVRPHLPQYHNGNYYEYVEIPVEQPQGIHHPPPPLPPQQPQKPVQPYQVPDQSYSTEQSHHHSDNSVSPQLNIKSSQNEGYKPVYFVTTPYPILVTSTDPIYKNQPPQHLHPVSSIRPTYSPDHIQKVSSTSSPQSPTEVYFLRQPVKSPKIELVRQHLTETTATPKPAGLRPSQRYHSRYSKIHPTNIPLTSPTSLKLKPSQKYYPINVPKTTTTVRTTASTAIAQPHLPTRYSDNYPQLQHHPHSQSSGEYHEGVSKYGSSPYPDIKSSSLAEILRKLQASNHLPQTITPDNIDNSIKTLIKILNNLKESQTIVENPPQYHEGTGTNNDDDYSDTTVENPDPSHPGPNSGRPGVDYPALAEIPQTAFSCKEQRYKGFFGDPETNCQVWHYCDLNGGKASFLCPNGTIFSQVALTCDWWFNVKCSSTAQLYVLNERLYKYILPFTPKFPEDYSGPLVDKYLAIKFKEMEEKMAREKMKGRENGEENTETSESKINNDTEKTIEEKESSSEEINPRQTEKSSTENQSNSVNLVDVEENRGSVDSGLPYNNEQDRLTLRPIVVSTTLVPSSSLEPSENTTDRRVNYSSSSSSISSSTSTKASTQRPQRHRFYHRKIKPQRMKVEVQSEKVEVIEIKTDGSTGHLIPPLNSISMPNTNNP